MPLAQRTTCPLLEGLPHESRRWAPSLPPSLLHELRLNQPLAGSVMRLIVTRPAAQAQAWVQALQALKVDAHALPLLGIEPVADIALLQSDWRDLASLALVMFVSANAVQHFFAARPEGLAWPPNLIAASTGPGTTAALREAGAVLIEQPAPEEAQFDSEALWRQLRVKNWMGRRVLIVRGEEGRSWLADTLHAAGAQVTLRVAYRRVAPHPNAAEQALMQAALARPAEHRWFFSSSEAVGQLQRLAPQADWGRSAALASHPRIAQAAMDIGFGQVDVVAPYPQAVAFMLGQG